MLEKTDLIFKKQKIEVLKQVGLYDTIENFYYTLYVIQENHSRVLNVYNNDILLRTCYGMNSSIDTLKILDELLLEDDFIDTYVLIRKIRDNLFLDMFILCVTDTYEIGLTDKQYRDLCEGNFDEDYVMSHIEKVNKMKIDYKNGKITKEDVRAAVNKFFDSSLDLDSNKTIRRKFFDYSKYNDFLEENFENIGKCQFTKKMLKDLSRILNNYVHSNGINYVSNSDILAKKGYVKVIEDINQILSNLLYIFIIYIFYIDSRLFSSSDYFDNLEMGIIPPKDSQYEIAPIFEEILSNLKSLNSEVFEEMKNNNRYNMKIDVNSSL